MQHKNTRRSKHTDCRIHCNQMQRGMAQSIQKPEHAAQEHNLVKKQDAASRQMDRQHNLSLYRLGRENYYLVSLLELTVREEKLDKTEDNEAKEEVEGERQKITL